MDLFAAELAAEKLFDIGPFGFTNSMLLGLIGSAVIILLLTAAAKRIKPKTSSRFGLAIEAIIEYVIELAAGVMHSRTKAVKFAPLYLGVFLFILLNNWLGLMPGVGPITVNGHPLLRPFTADLNGTLALAVFTVILIQVYAIKELGIFTHLKHYFSEKPYNPINFFVGILEILGEFTKMASLSLRLFGNVFAGEVLLVTIAGISGYLSSLTTLPFYFLEVFVGFIQAFVFTMLTIVFLAVATHHEHEDEAAAHEPAHQLEPVKVMADE